MPWMQGWTFARAARKSAGLAADANAESYKRHIEGATAAGTCFEAEILAELYGFSLVLLDALSGDEVLSHEPTANHLMPSASSAPAPMSARQLVLLHTTSDYDGESTGAPAHYDMLDSVKPWTSVVPPDNFRLMTSAPAAGSVSPASHAGADNYRND